jgi:hypothetical protein
MDQSDYPNFIDPQKYPNFWEQIKNFKDFAVKVGQNAATGNEVFVSEETINERLKICSECSQFNSESKKCYLCGCFMQQKVKFTNSSCPVLKW